MASTCVTKGSYLIPSKVLRLVMLGVLALIFAGLTGCVSADEHKRLQTAFDQARQQLAEAENDLRVAQAKITELEAKIAELNRLLDAGSSGVGALMKERDLLAARLADLQKKYDELAALGGGAPVLPGPVNAALQDLAKQYPDLLEFDEKLGMIRLKSDLTFDVGSTEVKPAAKAALARFATILNMEAIAKNEVQVVGHTDDIPIRAGGPTAARNPDNWTLSTNRAWAVLAVLRGSGMSETRGMAAGWGDQRPIATNAPGRRGNEKNRRVDIYIRPNTVPEGIVISTPGSSTPAPPARRSSTPSRGTTPAPGRGTTPAPSRGTTTSPSGVPVPM